MTRRELAQAFALTAACRPLLSYQSAKPDFTGAWDLDIDRTEGPFTPPGMIQTIDHKDPVFKWTTKFKDEGTPKLPQYLSGLAVPSGEIRTDGHYETVKVTGGEKETHTVWSAGKLITIWTIRTLHDPSQGKWQRSLSEDGKTQNLLLEFQSTMMGTVQARLVFIKV